MPGAIDAIPYAVRALARGRQFTIAALAGLAVGIGATSGIVALVDAVLLRPLPFPDPERLVLRSTVRERDGQSGLPFSLPDFFDVRDRARTVGDLNAWAFGRGNLSADQPEQVQFAVTTASFFGVLGTRPALGRAFRDADDRTGAPAVAIVSHGLWQRRFGGDPALVGRAIRVDGRPYEVVGILPASFRFLGVQRDTDVWLPLGSDPFGDRRYARGVRGAGVIGGLRTGATLAAAQTEMDALAADLARAYPGENRGRGIRVLSLREQVVGNLRAAVLVLSGAVVVLLLIACANVANLLLARATARRRELAIRAALGAGRGRLLRQLFAEYTVLGLAGGMLGLVVRSPRVESGSVGGPTDRVNYQMAGLAIVLGAGASFDCASGM
jgi:putative ABC transport system permease protein